jgi:hypothetical protein
MEPKSIAEMTGEMFREAAVLVTVFVPLDVLLAFYSSFGWKEIVLLVESALMVGAALGILGIAMERKRTR